MAMRSAQALQAGGATARTGLLVDGLLHGDGLGVGNGARILPQAGPRAALSPVSHAAGYAAGDIRHWSPPLAIVVALLVVIALLMVIGAVFAVGGGRRSAPIERDWGPAEARLATATFDGDRVTVHNVRHAVYRSTTDFDVHWETREYDLATVASAWFIVEPFADWRGPAHTFVSFGFADGRYLAVSAEMRKERNERFSALRGLLRTYDLMIVVGDERDLIGLRALHRRDDVFLYRLRIMAVEARALLEALLRRANALAERPAFYNTLCANCTTTITDEIEALAPGRVPRSWRLVLPRFSDDHAFDLGLIDTDLPRATYREAHRINALAEAAAGAEDFSARLRPPRAPPW
jgi:hypothetical protein